MKRLIRDPLVIFLFIGGGLFLLYAKLNPEAGSEEANPNLIEITSDIQNMLVSEWSARWNREPTPEEFKGLLDSYIKEEILFREATKLGLGESDSIIRRRLAQKMEFLTSDIADLEEVSDETLQKFFREQADNYSVESEIGFRHLYFSTDKREDAAGDATAMLSRLKEGSLSIEDAIDQTDRTLLSPEFSSTALSLIGRQFGEEFASGIDGPQPDEWFGPVTSGYGAHLVKILEKTDGFIPELESIRETVLADYRYEQREKLNQSMLDSLLEQYDIVIDAPVEEASETGESTEP